MGKSNMVEAAWLGVVGGRWALKKRKEQRWLVVVSGRRMGYSLQSCGGEEEGGRGKQQQQGGTTIVAGEMGKTIGFNGSGVR
ncbi:hypothetical protein BHE74_00003757 [Ensete ventricosum]|nr:hypothetical protein BHE74_00003757 [Ensete ventricosum]RZS21620.1 hypothetical protein BHM03_00054279 [Ensete ventricosum]